MNPSAILGNLSAKPFEQTLVEFHVKPQDAQALLLTRPVREAENEPYFFGPTVA